MIHRTKARFSLVRVKVPKPIWLMRRLIVLDVSVCFGVCVCVEGVWWEPGSVRTVLGVWSLWEQPQVSHLNLVIFDSHLAQYSALNEWLFPRYGINWSLCHAVASSLSPPPAPKFGLSSWDFGHNLCGRVEKSRIGSYPSDLDSN